MARIVGRSLEKFKNLEYIDSPIHGVWELYFSCLMFSEICFREGG